MADTQMALWLFVGFCLVSIPALGRGSYVPLASGKSVSPRSIVCPMECKCSFDDMSAQCAFSFSNYSVTNMLPWKLTSLSIHGNDKTWKSEFACASVQCVLLKDKTKHNFASMDVYLNSFSQLKSLDLSYVPIQTVSNTDFKEFSELTSLTLSHNNISHVQDFAFEKLQKLEILNLDGNKLTSVTNKVFSMLNSVKKLQLRSNSLDLLKGADFYGLENLVTLDLQNNMIKQLETLVPSLDLYNLKHLYLQGNGITYILNETVNKFASFQSIDLRQNPLQCTCALADLVKFYQINSTMFSGTLVCSGPDNYANRKLSELTVELLSCEGATITSMSQDLSCMHQDQLVLDCDIGGDLPLVAYWITPWGETFTYRSSKEIFPESMSRMKLEETYHDAINLFLLPSRVHIATNGSLIFEKFRGNFAGEFHCVAENLMGSSNKSVTVGVYSKLAPTIYFTSLYLGALASAAMLGLAIITGAVRFFVNRCIHADRCNCCCCDCEDVKIVDVRRMADGKIEVTYAVPEDHESIQYIDDPQSDKDPPDPPVNSPMMRLSPNECRTPCEDEVTTQDDEERIHVWDQLDEVRSRLTVGAGRKIRKVQAHVRSITDTGSVKMRNLKDASSMRLQSIKESSTAAASMVKKNVTSGMVQVKYSVQSLKEFCGTGDMGPGTISTVSVTTDVDNQEVTKVIKKQTFV